MTTAEARERVARGAALLDDKRPGWSSEIDPTVLRMQSCELCVIGQCFGSYAEDVLDLLIPMGERSRDYGFDLGMHEVGWRNWNRLRDAWLDAITERLTPPVSWTHRDAAVRVEG